MAQKWQNISWLSAIVVSLGVGLVMWSTFKISAIACWAENEPCTPTQIAQFNQLLGKRILFLSDPRLTSRATADTNYQFNDYHFELPGTLVIHLAKQTPAYLLASEGQSSQLIISTTGQTMSDNSVSALTTVFVDGSTFNQVINTSEVPFELHQSLQQLLATLTSANLVIPVLNWSDDQTVALDAPHQPQIIIDPTSVRTDLARLKATLQALQAQPPATQVAEIDVRFHLPVLRPSPTITRHDPQ